MALIDGIKRNCEQCGANYGQYNENKDNNFTEFWIQFGNKCCETKGLCQLCNTKSKYFINK